MKESNKNNARNIPAKLLVYKTRKREGVNYRDLSAVELREKDNPIESV